MRFIVIHPEYDLISNNEGLVGSQGGRKWAPGSWPPRHHFWELRSNSGFEVHCRGRAGPGLSPALPSGKMLPEAGDAQVKKAWLGTEHGFMRGDTQCLSLGRSFGADGVTTASCCGGLILVVSGDEVHSLV